MSHRPFLSKLRSRLRDLVPQDPWALAQMKFVIRFRDRKIPDFDLGPRGHELSCYIPDGHEWRQLNYGQAEGLVEIDGREWSFYFGPNKGDLDVHLEAGELKLDEALNFVRAVATKIAGNPDTFDIYISGNASPERHLQRAATH